VFPHTGTNGPRGRGDAVDRRLRRRAAPAARRMKIVTVRHGRAAEYTLSDPHPQDHSLRSIHYAPVLPVQCAGGRS